MAPVLSPKKSIEGAVGGVAGAALLGVIYAAATQGKMAEYALICAVGALISMVGDLAASAIKRNQNIKDYGKLIPGHGGILDRFDSVIITAPVFTILQNDSWNLGDIRNEEYCNLGSTGSIGTQTLDVARKTKTFVCCSQCRQSVEKLEEQIREFHPLLAAVWDEKAARDLKTRIADTDTKVVSGMEGLLELASMPESEILVTAIVGMIGIRPTMEESVPERHCPGK